MNILELKNILNNYDENIKIKICVSDDGDSVLDIIDLSKKKNEDILYIDCGWEK